MPLRRWMIREAIASGELVEGEPGLVVEGTAGNTGIGLALAARVFGFECVIVIARTQTSEKKDLLRQCGAKLIEVDAVPFSDDNHYTKGAQRLADELRAASRSTGGPRVLYADQWDNLANQRSHAQGTGPEIWRQTGGQLAVFNCAVGTGGTLSGVGEYLRSVDAAVQVWLTDPKGAAMYWHYAEGVLRAEGSSISEGIGQGRVTGQLRDFAPDAQMQIDDRDMMHTLHALQQEDGLMLGLSSGINVAGAVQCAKRLGLGAHDSVATILCDLSHRYATKQFNKAFLESKNLPTPPWYDENAVGKDETLLEALRKATV